MTEPVDGNELEEFYNIFLHESHEGIWRATLEKPLSVQAPIDDQIEHVFKHTTVTRCNKVFAEVHGFASPDDLVGRPLLEFISREDDTNRQTLRTFVWPGYRIHEAETHKTDQNNNQRWFLNNLIGIVETASLKRVWGVQWEITEQMRAEQERTVLLAKLSPRQKAILLFLAAGLSPKEIGGVINISAKTVETHLIRLLKKLGFDDVRSLKQHALALGLGLKKQ
jgi:DNA-binding CsgD family transcriptional regulator